MDDANLKALFATDREAFVKALVGEFGQYEVANADLTVDGFTFDLVDEEGGTEGGGDYVSRVVQVTADEGGSFFVRFTGSYASYHGTDYDDEFEFVVPREVTVTQYFPE